MNILTIFKAKKVSNKQCMLMAYCSSELTVATSQKWDQLCNANAKNMESGQQWHMFIILVTLSFVRKSPHTLNMYLDVFLLCFMPTWCFFLFDTSLTIIKMCIFFFSFARLVCLYFSCFRRKSDLWFTRPSNLFRKLNTNCRQISGK